MEIRVCPECNKAFYAPEDGDSLICPHCGYILLDRRTRERLKKELDFTFSLSGKRFPAKLRDYSDTGVRMVYRGPRLKADTVLDVEIDELNIKGPAKAVWSRKISKSTASTGLMLLLHRPHGE